MDEFLFFIQCSDKEKKEQFISEWKQLYYKTKNVSPFDRYGNQRGSLEGMLISLSASKSGLNIKSNQKIDSLFNSFKHHVSFEKVNPNQKNISII